MTCLPPMSVLGVSSWGVLRLGYNCRCEISQVLLNRIIRSKIQGELFQDYYINRPRYQL